MARKAASASASKKSSITAARQPEKSATTVTRKTSFGGFGARLNREVTSRALVAELVGTFVLTSVAVFSGDSFFTGLTLLVLVLIFGGVSGAHVNPAVTFGLWSARLLPGIRVPFFWAAQFIGALAAIVMKWLFAGSAASLSLASFGSFEAHIFFAELVGTALFVMGIVAVTSRNQSEAAKAVGVGFSLTIGIVLATSLLSAALQSAGTTSSDSRLSKVNNVTLNPAVALALEEKADSKYSATGQPVKSTDSSVSRLTLETILGPLVGGALGANLMVLLVRDRRS